MSLFLYSTNPAFSHHVAEKYLNNKHCVWCSDKYDPEGAPSASPCEIFIMLQKDCSNEDTHSSLINGYKKKFRRLAMSWEKEGKITESEKTEIVTKLNSKSWNMWHPQIYIICRQVVEDKGKLRLVPVKDRAALCEEWQIADLDTAEFEIIERVK